MKKITFLVPYPFGQAPSQRFRFEQYIEILQQNELSPVIKSFYSAKAWELLYQDRSIVLKIMVVSWAFVKRVGHLVYAILHSKKIFIHREVLPLGPPIFEWILVKMARKQLIYDFDDAIWIPNVSESNRWISRLKWHSKVKHVCKWSWRVSAGNSYLAAFAGRYNKNVFIIPTTIDTVNHHNPDLYEPVKKQIFTIGWTGSHSTLKYLDIIVPVLRKLEVNNAFKLMVISDKAPSFKLKSLEFRRWNKSSEIKDLMHFDVGIMPLTDDQWAKGKCGFKALQYMAMGVVPIVSAVGVNTDIVEDGVNGYVVESVNDWGKILESVLRKGIKSSNLQLAARKTIEERYAVTSCSNLYQSLLQD